MNNKINQSEILLGQIYKEIKQKIIIIKKNKKIKKRKRKHNSIKGIEIRKRIKQNRSLEC